MSRKCSHCGDIGHNTRTCTAAAAAAHKGGPSSTGVGTGVRLFGVQLDPSSSNSTSLSCVSMRKSLSMDCFPSSSSSSSLTSSRVSYNINNGIHSDKTNSSVDYNINPNSYHDLLGTTQERKKGMAWTEEEHRSFLVGLDKLGKGDWKGISKNYVITRTPTQVASHAQKYFLRLSTFNTKKRRSSLFDMAAAASSSGSEPIDSAYAQSDTILPFIQNGNLQDSNFTPSVWTNMESGNISNNEGSRTTNFF